jgi:hypothetical protein
METSPRKPTKNAPPRAQIQKSSNAMPLLLLPFEIKSCLVGLPFLSPCDAAASNFVQEVDNNIVLLNPETVEMLPYGICELVLALSSQFLASGNGWGVEADAPRLGENPLVDVILEGGRCV